MVIDGLHSTRIQVEVAQVVVHETDEPNALVNLFYPHIMSSKHRTEVDFLAFYADPAACRDSDCFVMEWVRHWGNTVERPVRRSIQINRSLHLKRLMRSFVVIFVFETLEHFLLLEHVHACWAGAVLFERSMHPFMTSVLLRVARLDTFNGNPQAQPIN